MSVSVCTQVRMSMFVYAYSHTGVWRVQDNFEYCSSGIIHLVFLTQGLSVTKNSLRRLNWLASKAQRVTCLCLEALALQMQAIMPGFFAYGRY